MFWKHDPVFRVHCFKLGVIFFRIRKIFARSAFYVLCVLDPLRCMSVCLFVVCTDFWGKVPRGSKGVTALWPRGVLNEMIRNSQNHWAQNGHFSLFLDQFQIKEQYIGPRGPKTGHFSGALRAPALQSVV